jgi:hypothetical protein
VCQTERSSNKILPNYRDALNFLFLTLLDVLLLEKAREVGALEAEQFGRFRLVPVTAAHGWIFEQAPYDFRYL